MSDPLATADLIDIVCARAIGWEAAERCCNALKALPVGTVQGHAVPKSDIETIYRIRLSRPVPADVVGTDRLLSDLAGYSGDDLTMVTLPPRTGRDIHVMFFEKGATRLLTCFVGPDRRLAEV